jgi:hypothetical protein
MRIGKPSGLLMRAFMRQGDTDLHVAFSCIRGNQQITFMKNLPRTLFPSWKDGDRMPKLRVSIEWSYAVPHPSNFYGCRQHAKSLPEVYRADKVASFAIRVELVDSEPQDAQ